MNTRAEAAWEGVGWRACLWSLGAFVLVCAFGEPPGSGEASGGWIGLLHGFVAPWSLLVSLVCDVRMFDVKVTHLYEWGFFAGFFGFFLMGLDLRVDP